mgnify:CR=1 FL=1
MELRICSLDNQAAIINTDHTAVYTTENWWDDNIEKMYCRDRICNDCEYVAVICKVKNYKKLGLLEKCSKCLHKYRCIFLVLIEA